MGRICRSVFFGVAIALFSGVRGGFCAEKKGPVITHADAAVMLAKYSGFFDRYVPENASLDECVAFLNKHGIYFGLLEVVNGTRFTPSDCARAMGQIDLLLRGEAVFSGGKVKLPEGLDSWREYCSMNEVEFMDAYRTMGEMLRIAHGQNQ